LLERFLHMRAAAKAAAIYRDLREIIEMGWSPCDPRGVTCDPRGCGHGLPPLHQLCLLTALDVMPLAAYCAAYWREATEALAPVAERDPVTAGLLITTAESNARANPLARIAAEAAGDMVRYAGEFGFSPAARARTPA
jgi:P27 family predicted phage terminase small subunit